MNFAHNNTTDDPTNVPLPPVLERIANIRQSINDLAQDPAVLEFIRSGCYHPDLRLGDAIQALDELAFALSEFQQSKIVPLYRLTTKPGVQISLKLQQTQEQ